MREFLNRSRESWALIRSPAQNSSLAVFIHGFRGGYLSTWGKLPELLNTHADAQAAFAKWDYLFVGYNTRHVRTYLDIAGILATQWEAASTGAAPFGHAYNRLALFGHSLGTLGIRQLLCASSERPAGMTGAIHSITLFGTPLNGSPLAGVAAFPLIGYKIAAGLKPRNAQLRMLKAWTKSAHAAGAWPAVRIVLGQDDRVVGDQFTELIEWSGDHRPILKSVLDHGAIVKPSSWAGSELVDYVSRGL